MNYASPPAMSAHHGPPEPVLQLRSDARDRLVLVHGMAGSPELALGFYLVMLIPGSSMAIAYTGMAGGSVADNPDS